MPKKSDSAWYEHHKKYNTEYNRKNTFTISVKLNINTDLDLIETYMGIKNKTQFIKEALAEYQKKHGY